MNKMSDDLISRKALYERVEKSMYENPHSDSKVRQMHNHEHAHFLCMIMQEPTAFDKEKVIEELQKNSHNYYPSIDHYCTSQKAVRLKDAVDIVEKGGIE